MRVSAERFWSLFLELLPAFLAREDWPTVYKDNIPWTSFMLKRFLPEIGKELGFRGPREIDTEWCNIDLSFFTINSPVQGRDHNWDWEVAIEHENEHKHVWLDEFSKLSQIIAGLKVIITYHEFKKITIEDKLSIAKDLYRQRLYRQNDDAWLLIFGPAYERRTDEPFRAFTFDGSAFTPLRPLTLPTLPIDAFKPLTPAAP